MGQLSGWVLLVFVGLHVSLVMCALALGGPKWLEGSKTFNVTSTGKNGTVGNHTTEVYEGRVSLWTVCANDTCEGIVEDDNEPKWFKAARINEVVCVAAIVVSLVFFYGFALCKRCEDSAGVVALIVILVMGATGTGIASSVLFGKNTSHGFPIFLPDYETAFGWTFYVGCIGAFVNFLCFLCLSRVFCIVQGRQRPYENI